MDKQLNPSNLQRLFSRKRLRKFWLNVHLVLALTIGFVFVMMGLSGSCIVFYNELEELQAPALSRQSQTSLRSLDDIMLTVKAAHPQRTGEWAMLLPGYQGRRLG